MYILFIFTYVIIYIYSQNPIIFYLSAIRNRVPSKNLRSYSSTKFTTLHMIPRDLFVKEIMAHSPDVCIEKKKKKYLQTQEISPAGFRHYY